MNKVILMGRLSQDIEMKYSGEVGIARTSMAVQRNYKDKKTNEYGVDFFNLVAFNKNADLLQKYFSKGMRIGIEGHIQTGSYTDKNGQKRYTFDIVIDAVEFIESKSTSNNSSATVKSDDLTSIDGFVNVSEDLGELPFN